MASMVDRDSVTRLVKQLLELIARALTLKADNKHGEALEVLESGSLLLLGVDFRTLVLVDSTSGAELLKEVTRIRGFAQLLEAMAEVEASRGNTRQALGRQRHAVELYAEVLKRRPADAEAQAALERLR
jgi:hypothetical protein